MQDQARIDIEFSKLENLEILDLDFEFSRRDETNFRRVEFETSRDAVFRCRDWNLENLENCILETLMYFIVLVDAGCSLVLLFTLLKRRQTSQRTGMR